LGNKKLGLIDNWLRHIRDVKAVHAKELDAIPDIEMRTNRLAELKYATLPHLAGT
jgi:carbonic anhydrase